MACARHGMATAATSVRLALSHPHATGSPSTMNVADPDAARPDGQTQEVAELMEYDGVIPETVVNFVES